MSSDGPAAVEGHTSDVFDEDDQKLAELEAEMKQMRAEFEAELSDLRETVETLRQQVQQDASGDDAVHMLERLAGMSQDEREAVLGEEERAKLRAVEVYENWADIAWELGTDDDKKWGVDTNTTANKKHSPAKVGVELRKVLGEDLSWNQMYRVMKAIAELSGGSLVIDQYDRDHVAGGEFEYHEKSTPDGQDTKKVLYRTPGWSE